MPIDELTYPAPVANRSGPGPSSPPAPVSTTPTTPRVRVFPLTIRATASSRSSAATPVLRGPVIILDFSLHAGAAVDPPREGFEIGWSRLVNFETSVALTVVRPYTVLTEYLDPQAQTADSVGQGFPFNTLNSPQKFQPIPLGLIVDAPEVSVVVAVISSGAGVNNYQGHVRVVEQVSAEALANFR